MKGSVKRMVTLSAEGVLHDAANGDVGRGASTPVSLEQAGDILSYKLCGHCFEKLAAKQRGDEKPEAEVTEEKVEAPVLDELPDEVETPASGHSPQSPAKGKGAKSVG